MAEPGTGTEAGAGIGRRRRKGAAVAASLLAHVAVLAWLSLRIATHRPPRPADAPDFQVELTRRAPAPAVRGAASPQARSTLTGTPRLLSRDAASSAPPTVVRPPPVPQAAAPAMPAPSAAAPAPSAGLPAPGGTGSGSLAGPSTGDVRGLLRGALGCAHADLLHLDAAERAACAERLGLASRTAPHIDPIPAEKRAYYDAVAAAYARTNAPPGNAPAWSNGAPKRDLLDDRGGMTIPLVACGMRFGIPRAWRSYHDLPPHALKLAQLGPLKCFVPPPSGRGFEESGVEAPASLRERTDDAAHMKALDAPKPQGP